MKLSGHQFFKDSIVNISGQQQWNSPEVSSDISHDTSCFASKSSSKWNYLPEKSKKK